jgi:transposase
MQPLSGHSSDAHEFGQVIKDPMAHLHTPSGATYLVADSALYSAANLQKLAAPPLQWITRVPATLAEAQAVLAPADSQTMAPLRAGYRSRVLSSPSGGVAQCWVRLSSEQRQPQAQRTVDTQGRQQSDEDVKAFKRLCRTACACAAEAQQALTRLEAGLQTALLHDSTMGSTPPSGQRGRPGPGAQPDPFVYHMTGALASRLTDRQARIDQQRGFILATNELDEEQFSAQAVLDGSKGPARAERGFRCLKAPQFWASSLSLKKPERVMALFMGMTVCWLVSAALEYRMRNALKDTAAPFADQKGKRIQHPTARWVFHSFVGMHGLYIPGQGLFVLNLTDEHQHLLQLLGKRYVWFYR